MITTLPIPVKPIYCSYIGYIHQQPKRELSHHSQKQIHHCHRTDTINLVDIMKSTEHGIIIYLCRNTFLPVLWKEIDALKLLSTN